jgi:hypothetical protein
VAARFLFAVFIIDCLEGCGDWDGVNEVEEVDVDAVSVDLAAPCFEESSSGMVICLSVVVVESVVVLCERAIESKLVGRTVFGDFVLGRVCESVDSVVLGLKESSFWSVVGVSLFVPCEEAMVVSSSESESLVSPGLASLFVPCEEAIVMSSSGSGSVGRSVSVFFVLGGVLFCGGVRFGFGKFFKRTSVSPLLYPVLDLEETEEADELEEAAEADESDRSRGSSFLLPDFDFKMVEDSFFLLGKVVRVAGLGCGHESDSASRSCPLSRSLRLFSLWLEVLSL